MTVYKGANQGIGGRLFWVPLCVTREDKALFWAMAVVGGMANGGLVGFILGLVSAAFTAGPVAATGVGAALAALLGTAEVVAGLAIGAVVGAALGFAVAWKSSCPECGLCFKILCISTVFPATLLSPLFPIIPLVVLPNTGDCGTIPPGCP